MGIIQGSNLPSGAGATDLWLPSQDPVLPSELADVYQRQQAVEQVMSAARMASMTGALEQSVSNVVDMLRGLASDLGVDTHNGAPIAGGPGRATNGSQKPPEPAPRPDTPPEGAAPPRPYHTFSEGRAEIKDLTMRGAIQKAGGVAARYFSEKAPSGWTYNEEDGSYSGPMNTRLAPDDPGYSTIDRRMRVMGKASALGTAISEGRAGAALGTIGRFAGPIGMATGAVIAGGQFMESQYEAGAQYRAAYGEDAGRFALSQRAGELMTGLQGFGTVGMGRARQNYQAAAGLGLKGAGIDEAVGFANDQYLKYGMDTGDSMQIVEKTTKNANLTLDQFSAAIEKVSKAAVEAGKSSEEAVKSFLATQSFLEGNVTKGSGSIGVASALTQAQENLPRSLQSGVGSRLAEMLTSSNINKVAGLTGADRKDLRIDIQTGNVDATLSTMSTLSDIIVRQVSSSTGVSVEAMKKVLHKDMSPDEVAEAAKSIDLDLGVLDRIFAYYGVPVSGSEGLTFFAEMVGGTLHFTSEQKGTTSASPFSTYGKGKGNYTDQIAKAAGGVRSDEKHSEGRDLLFGKYAEQVNQTGTGNTAIEALLRDPNKVKAATGKDLASTPFKIDGKEYSLAKIIESPELMKKFTAGDATVKAHGDTISVSELTGIEKASGASATGYQNTIGLTKDAQQLVRLMNGDGPSKSQRDGVPAPSYSGSLNDRYSYGSGH